MLTVLLYIAAALAIVGFCLGLCAVGVGMLGECLVFGFKAAVVIAPIMLGLWLAKALFF